MVRVKKDGFIGYDSQEKAEGDDTANLWMELGIVNGERAIGMTKKGGDFTQIVLIATLMEKRI